MDFTVPIVIILLFVVIPLRNKAIKEYRKRKNKKDHED